jgi:hypothetical protein
MQWGRYGGEAPVEGGSGKAGGVEAGGETSPLLGFMTFYGLREI